MQVVVVLVLFVGTLALLGFLILAATAAHVGLSLTSGSYALLACLGLTLVHYFCYKRFTSSLKQLLVISGGVLAIFCVLLAISMPTFIKQNAVNKEIDTYNARYNLKDVRNSLKSEGYQITESVSQADLDMLVGKWSASVTIVKVEGSYYLDGYTYSETPFDKIDSEKVLYDIQYQKNIWKKLEIQEDMIVAGDDTYLFLTDKGPFYVQVHTYPDYPGHTRYDHALLVKKP